MKAQRIVERDNDHWILVSDYKPVVKDALRFNNGFVSIGDISLSHVHVYLDSRLGAVVSIYPGTVLSGGDCPLEAVRIYAEPPEKRIEVARRLGLITQDVSDKVKEVHSENGDTSNSHYEGDL